MTRYPFVPLARAAGTRSLSQAAAIFGVSAREVARWRRDGLSASLADELACRADLRPLNIWPSWRGPTALRRPRPCVPHPIAEVCAGSGALVAGDLRATCPGCGAEVAVNPSASTLRRHGRRSAA